MTNTTQIKSVLKYLFRFSLLCFFSFVFVLPIVFLVFKSVIPETKVVEMSVSGSQGQLDLSAKQFMRTNNFKEVVKRVPFGRYLFNSFYINALIVLFGLLVNSLAAYALARLRWPGREAVLIFVLAVFIVPFESIAIPMFFQFCYLGWRDCYSVQIVPFIANPLSIYLFYSFFLKIPRELEESAKVDGAGIFRTFFFIVVPNSKPVFAAVTIVTFLFSWGSYLWPLLMTTGESVRPLPLGIATFYTTPPIYWGEIFAFGLMMVFPVVVVFIVFQKWFVRSIETTGIKE